MKKVVFTFGRMNPPTTGHQLLVNKLVAYARQVGAAPRVYLSHSVGAKDPLQYDKKVAFARAAFGSLVKKSNARTVIEVLKQLDKEGYTHVTMFAGSDRVPEFTKLLTKYNGKEYNFEQIEVKSAGERDPDADDVSGMSASKMRALAKDDKVAEFLRGAPNTLKAAQAKNMFTAVRRALLGEDVMDYALDEKFISFIVENDEHEDEVPLPSDTEIERAIDGVDLDLDDSDALMLDLILDGEDSDNNEIHEGKVLSAQARQKLSQRMKGMSKRLARLRQIKAKQMPASQRLRMRARKAALMILRKRATGKKNLDYNSLSRSQRIAVDNALVNRFGKGLKSAVEKISKRLIPAVRKKAQVNVAKARDVKESYIVEAEKGKEGSARDKATDKIQAARRGISVADWEKTKADAAHDSPLNVDATKLNTLDTDPTLNDRQAQNPTQSHLHVNKKLMHYARNDEEYVHEGRKSADDKDARDAGDTNIIYQMRKVVNSRGEHETVFADRHKAHISIADAKKLLAKFDALRLPADKHEFTIQAGKSLASFRDVLAHGVKHQKKGISLGGRQFKEFYLGVGRSRTTSAYDNDEPPGVRRIAEVAKDEDRPTDPNKSRPLSQKVDLLLRLGLVDQEELQNYRRALRSSKKFALQSPKLREKLADLLDKLIDLTTKDPATYSRVRYNVVQKEALSLLNKAEKSGVDVSVIFEVFARGYEQNEDINEAFSRVNSFIAGGKAAELDKDLTEGEVIKTKLATRLLHKKGIVGPHEIDTNDMLRNWFGAKKGVHPKASGADAVAYHGNTARFYDKQKGTHFDVKGGAPRFAVIDKSGKLAPSPDNTNVPMSYKQDKVQKKKGNVVKFSSFKKKTTKEEIEHDLAEDGKGYQSPSGGLTQKGRDHYNRTTGSNLKAPVTTPPSKLKKGGKAAGRRASFCARMGGMKKRLTSAKTARDPNSRINKALRKWNCRSEETDMQEKRGLWDNIHAKRARIKAGSGERMRKPGSKGAPTDAALKASQTNEDAPCWKDYKQVGMKMKGGRSVPNCVPKEAANPAQQAAIAISMKKAGKTPKNESVYPERHAAAKKILGKVAKDKGGKVGFQSTTYKDGKRVTTHGHYNDKGERVVTHTTNEETVNEISSALLYRAKQAAQKKAGWLMPGDKGKGDKAWNRVKKFRDAGVAKEKQERAVKKEEYVNEGGVRSMARGNVKGRDYDPNKMFGQLARPKNYLKPWEKSKAVQSADLEKAKQDFAGAVKKLPPGKKTPKSMVRPRDWMKPNQASKVGVTENEAPLSSTPVRGIDSGKSNKKVFEQNMTTHDAVPLAKRVKRVKSFHAWHPKNEQHTHPTGKTPYSDLTNKELRADLTKKVKSASEAYTGSEPVSGNRADPANRFVGTDAIRQNYASVTPGQGSVAGEIAVAKFAPEKVDYTSSMIKKTRTEVDQSKENLGQKNLASIRKALGGIRESVELNESFAAGFELAPFARDYGIEVQSGFEHHPEVQAALDAQEEAMNEAIYQGRDVPLNKPMKGDVKKSKVYVRDPSTGNVKKVNFGDKKLSIKKDQPGRKRSYCARSSGQGNLTKKTSANYWSRRAWDC